MLTMSELQTKIRKTQYWLKHNVFVFDNIIIFIALALCLIWTWGTISSMSRNWSLAQELSDKQREKALLELEVETLELENEYYLSEEYQDIAARKYQNKMSPGETMIYLPNNSETAKNKHAEEDNTVDQSYTDDTSNFNQWIKFLFSH